jgi:hypothetical protein
MPLAQNLQTSKRGFFTIDRGVWDHPSFAREKFSEREAWFWLVSSAAWEATRARIGKAWFDLERGQCVFALRFLAQKWMWSEARVRRFLKRRTDDAAVLVSATRGATLITLCNYDNYQASRRTDVPDSDAPMFEETTQRIINKQTNKEQITLSSLREERERAPKLELVEPDPEPANPKRRAKARTPLPEDWKPDEQDVEHAESSGFSEVQIEKMSRKFTNHHLGRGNLMACWHAAWRTWVGNEVTYHGRSSNQSNHHEQANRPQRRTHPASGSPPTRGDAIVAGMVKTLERRRAARAAADPGRQKVRGHDDVAGGADADAGPAQGDGGARRRLALLPAPNAS